jgi:Domain of unknown function (DUF5659)
LTQYICNDLKLATVLAFAGYKLSRMVSEPDGSKTWLFQNPGDIEDLVRDYENNVQAVSDVKSLLEIFEEQSRGKSNAPASTLPTGQVTELLPTAHPDDESRTYITRDTTTAILLHYAAYHLIRTEVQNRSVDFIWAWDDQLTDVVKKFNKNEWLVSPKKWTESAFVIRNIVRNAKGYGAAGVEAAV